MDRRVAPSHRRVSDQGRWYKQHGQEDRHWVVETGLHLKRRRDPFGKGELAAAQQHGHRCGIGWREDGPDQESYDPNRVG